MSTTTIDRDLHIGDRGNFRLACVPKISIKKIQRENPDLQDDDLVTVQTEHEVNGKAWATVLIHRTQTTALIQDAWLCRYDDFLLYDDGMSLLTPETIEARTWAAEHLGEDRVTLPCGSIGIDNNYVQDICHGILNDGLTIQMRGMTMYVGNSGDLCLR